VVKGKRQGTSNVGPVAGTTTGRRSTNVVTDYVHVPLPGPTAMASRTDPAGAQLGNQRGR